LGLTDDGGYIVFVDSDSHEIPAPNNFGFLKIEPDTITVSTNIQTLTSADIKQVRNYPNPFKHGTSIEYYISEKSNVEISIYNYLGFKTTTLISKSQSEGEH
jgi:hypothetical protein